MLIAPLIDYIKPGVWPTVFGLSGYSGAGTIGATDPDGRPTSIPKITPEALAGGVKPYALTDHIHERETGFHLSTLANGSSVKLAFVPAVTPWFSGIISTLSMPLRERLPAREVVELYEKKYGGERLVTIKKEVPSITDISNKHGWVVGGAQVHSEGERVVVVGGLDNLLKGAATQCLQVSFHSFCRESYLIHPTQNLNLALGYDEYAGIPI